MVAQSFGPESTGPEVGRTGGGDERGLLRIIHKLGYLSVGVLIIRALLFGSILEPLRTHSARRCYYWGYSLPSTKQRRPYAHIASWHDGEIEPQKG